MAEDSGAFKTKPANSGPVPAIVMVRERRCGEVSPAGKYRRQAFTRADF
jgi:hypothetical protein